MRLTTPRLVLRPPAPADRDWIAESCADPFIQRWLPNLPSPYQLADADWWLDHTRKRWEDRTAATFVVCDAASGDRLGVIDVRLGEVPDVGYWLAPEGRGRGAMTRALLLVTGYAFEERGLEQLDLYTLPENVASQRVAERAGFEREGTSPGHIPLRDGTRVDAIRFVRRR